MSEEKYERCAYACPECGRQCVLNQGHYPPIDAQKGILGFNLEKKTGQIAISVIMGVKASHADVTVTEVIVSPESVEVGD